ncbi:DUF1080 domain-containing protein [Rhodocytophaga rosea]|uniref:DUF1080 domain-containing protein n=2 Tax=Rhodocytophaga rosea TaxID=2704465 RepID=A0A6C0GUJ6_9BACT|nr:DUF1080 domain-containing protein [Rhodocytophaga rosea]
MSMYSGAGELPALAKDKITMENPEKSAQKDNELTAAEKKAGWKLLFDGKTTKGWHTYLKKGEEISPKWKVENGTLMLTDGGAGDIVTDEEFGDFELEMEWKIAEGGNSGIMYHVHEDPKFKATYATGPEVQVLDDARHPDAKQGKNGNRVAGSLYDMLPPTTNVTKPAGQFNKVRIVIKDGKAEHYMNSTKVVEYPTTGPEWEKMVNDSKFKGWEGFGKYSKGHIALQDHGNVVTFKNIKIRPL